MVTGDIAFSGTPAQYQEATAWIDQLAKAVRVKKDRILLVPGNHDVDRETAKSGDSGKLHRRLRKATHDVDDAVTKPEQRTLLAAKMRAYAEFAQAYHCGHDEGQLWYRRELDLNLGSIRVLGLNSALLSFDKNDERENLALGNVQLSELKEEGKLLLILQHHPPEWLSDGERAKGLIGQCPHLLFTGHDHLPSASTRHELHSHSWLFFRAGAAHSLSAPEEYAYSWGQLDATGLSYWPRVWVGRDVQQFLASEHTGDLDLRGAKRIEVDALPSRLRTWLEQPAGNRAAKRSAFRWMPRFAAIAALLLLVIGFLLTMGYQWLQKDVLESSSQSDTASTTPASVRYTTGASAITNDLGPEELDDIIRETLEPQPPEYNCESVGRLLAAYDARLKDHSSHPVLDFSPQIMTVTLERMRDCDPRNPCVTQLTNQINLKDLARRHNLVSYCMPQTHDAN